MSGILNGNSPHKTALGIFDYLKNFLVIFIYAAFFGDVNEYKNIFRILLFIAVLLGTVALIQFIWAMGSVYIFGKAITDKSIYILSNINANDADTLENITWRYGIFRTSSLTYHANILGLFTLLIFTVYFYAEKSVKARICVPLLSGVIASVSRLAYVGASYVVLVHMLKKRKWLLLVLLMIGILALTQMTIINNFNVSTIIKSYLPENEESIDVTNIRMYSRYKSIEIWKDHPYWGIGPGMFGGIVAFKYRSYINELYNLKLGYLGQVQSIEQFWFQIFAEMGIIGTVCFINLIIILFIVLYKEKELAHTDEIRKLFTGLMVFIPCIMIYGIGSGINIAPVLFTYCAFVGMGLGSCKTDFKHGNK